MAAKKMVLAEEEFVRPALGAQYTTAAELLAGFEDEGASIEVERVSAIYGHAYPTLVEIRVDRDYYGGYVACYLTEMTPRGAARRFGLDSYYDSLEARVYPVRVGA